MGTKQTVLVIEDNDLNMEIVAAALELWNYEVLQATDAETGIQLALKHIPDLILMDIQLPGMDGYTATRLIKRDRTIKDIPVVAMTTHAGKGGQEEAYRAGCSGFINKPFSLDSFMDTVKGYLQHREDDA
jgi:CheY-like chemotaxis protein